MNIQEAAKKANARGCGMYRRAWLSMYSDSNPSIMPTDTGDCCVVRTGTGEVPRWEPQLADLIQDDWELTG